MIVAPCELDYQQSKRGASQGTAQGTTGVLPVSIVVTAGRRATHAVHRTEQNGATVDPIVDGTGHAPPIAMTPTIHRWAVTGLSALLWASPALSAPASIQRSAPSAEATTRQPAAPQSTSTKRPAPASSADASRYAARDAQAPDAKRYRGGHETAVYVSASAVVVVLAVVLLIVLI